MSLVTVWYDLYLNFMIGPTPPCYTITVSSFRIVGRSKEMDGSGIASIRNHVLRRQTHQWRHSNRSYSIHSISHWDSSHADPSMSV